MSIPDNALQVDYLELGDTPQERALTLQAAARLPEQKRGLVSQRSLQVTREVWQSLLVWVSRTKPDSLRREGNQIRLLRDFDGHVIIGTNRLAEDLGELGTSASAEPTLVDVWRAGRRVLTTES